MCFNLENTYYFGYYTPTLPDHPGIPDQGISLQYREPFGETYHNGWGSTPDRSLVKPGPEASIEVSAVWAEVA